MKRKYDSMYGRCLSFLLIAALLCASLGPAFASGPAGQGEKAGAAQSRKPEPPALRALSAKEMQGLVGSGAHRQQSFCGSHPWWPTEKGVNIGNGNLAVGAGDLSVQAGRGLGLNFTRTYNANDDTVGGFGIGWTYSYDMTLTESGSGTAIHKLPDGTRVYVLRNADGSYTPPAWCHDTYSSTYQTTDNGNGTLRSDATGDTVAT
ncbi:MAG: hypothetical protein IT210_10105, partial [Armatimonadetes bacterium]|nr:hypothetical protein [Armatimonadota bacterium]